MVAKYVVKGHPYVKKSNQKVVYRASIGRQVKVDTPSYSAWHASAIRQLAEQGCDPVFKKRRKFNPKLQAHFSGRVTLQCKFYVKSNGRVDLSALYEGIQDVLVEVGVLDDDNWHIVANHDGSGVQKDPVNPRIEVTVISLEDEDVA